jgi:hypothetical protein
MNVFPRSAPAYFLCYLATALDPSVALADDELNSKVRMAWEKFSELEETKVNYGERAEVALTMLQTERERTEVEATVRTLRIQIDSFPTRRNNLQQEVFDEWLLCRQRLTGLDQYLAQLRSRWQELNEITIRHAEGSGKRVKPLDRAGLLNELQRLYRECVTAFDSLRTVLADVPSAQGLTAAQAFDNALNDLGGAGGRAHLVAPKRFRDAFRDFYGRQYSKKSTRSGRGSRRSRTAH